MNTVTHSDVEEFTKTDGDACTMDIIQKTFQHRFSKFLSKKLHPHIKASKLLTRNTTDQAAFALCNGEIICLDSHTLKNTSSIPAQTVASTNLKYSEENPNNLISSYSDGSFILWDTRTQTKCGTWSSNKAITSFDVSSNGRFLCAGTELVQSEAFILFWDFRSYKELGGYWNSHSDDITCIQYHPTSPYLVASSSTDSLINVFDSSLPIEDDALMHCLKNDEMVDSFYWSKSKKNNLICYSADHSIQHWNVDDLTPISNFSRSDITKAIYRNVPSECYLVPSDMSVSNDHLIAVGSGLEYLSSNCLRLLKYNESGDQLEQYAIFTDVSGDIIQGIVYFEQFNGFLSVSENSTATVWTPQRQKNEMVIKHKKKTTFKPY